MLSALFNCAESAVFEYSPNLIKASLTNYGLSSKESVEKSLNLIFGKKIDFETDDASDALAIAFCHSISRNKPKKLQSVVVKSKRNGNTLKNFAREYMETK